MAAGDSSDILMRIVYNKQPIPGESRTALNVRGVDSTNHFLKEFKPGEMFEVDSFTFEVDLDDESVQGSKAKADIERKLLLQQHGASPGTKPSAGARTSSMGQFLGWRNGQKAGYGIRVPPISFNRPVDKTSMLLLNHFVRRTTFDSAILVKRKATGGPAAGEPYLRLEFLGGVLLTEVSWQSGDPPTAACKFISRAINLLYRPQLSDGSLGEPKQGPWDLAFWEHGGGQAAS
jgi:type VI protein secretion system component Hcp